MASKILRMATKTLRAERILATVADLTLSLVVFDRKEDAELPVGSVEQALRKGELTIDEMAARFKAELAAWMQAEESRLTNST